jgi:L-asparaginase / beta-aspartyl-peptidase
LITLAIHGGAGALPKNLYSENEIQSYQSALKESLEAGYSILSQGGSAIDAVVKAVELMEDCPLFNSGRGSVLTSDGRVQMDATLMCGQTTSSGSVTLVESIKNPIKAARLVMKKTPHRLLGGADAEKFAKENGLEIRPKEYFITPKRVEQLHLAQTKGQILLDHDSTDNSNTVGAVALDLKGDLAAATSTGGLTNKYPGRVSDSSIVGAGTYANNETLCISATGTGDVFIQNVSCFDAHALMAYKGFDLTESCNEVLKKLASRGGNGGVIALDKKGDYFLGFNSGGMFRALKSSTGIEIVEIF